MLSSTRISSKVSWQWPHRIFLSLPWGICGPLRVATPKNTSMPLAVFAQRSHATDWQKPGIIYRSCPHLVRCVSNELHALPQELSKGFVWWICLGHLFRGSCLGFTPEVHSSLALFRGGGLVRGFLRGFTTGVAFRRSLKTFFFNQYISACSAHQRYALLCAKFYLLT